MENAHITLRVVCWCNKSKCKLIPITSSIESLIIKCIYFGFDSKLNDALNHVFTNCKRNLYLQAQGKETPEIWLLQVSQPLLQVSLLCSY